VYDPGAGARVPHQGPRRHGRLLEAARRPRGLGGIRRRGAGTARAV